MQRAVHDDMSRTVGWLSVLALGCGSGHQAAIDVGGDTPIAPLDSARADTAVPPSTLAGVYIGQLPYDPATDPDGLYRAVFGAGGMTDPNHIIANVDGMSPYLFFAAIDTTPADCDWGANGDACYSYDWTTFDADIAAILTIAPNWKINLLVQPANEGDQNRETPQYVFSSAYAAHVGAANPQDMAVCGSYDGGTGTGSPYGSAGCTTGCSWNTSTNPATVGVPVFYETPIMTAYQRFITQIAQHFSSDPAICAAHSSDCTVAAAIASHIGYVRFGMGLGSEVDPLCNTHWPVGPNGSFAASYVGATEGSPANNYIETMTKFEASAVTSAHDAWTLVFDTHTIGPLNGYPDWMADYAVAAGFGFGNNGLQISDKTNFAGGNACNADWCANAAKYSAEVPVYLQTFSESAPGGVLGFGGTSPGQQLTGSLTDLLPFAVARGATILEIYPCDAVFAFASTYAFDRTTGAGLPNLATNTASGEYCADNNGIPGAYTEATWQTYGGGAGSNNPYAAAIAAAR